MASNVFSVQGEAQPTLEGMQLGLEQGPVRKTPPLLIETTQISLGDVLPCFFSKNREDRVLQITKVSNENSQFLQSEYLSRYVRGVVMFFMGDLLYTVISAEKQSWQMIFFIEDLYVRREEQQCCSSKNTNLQKQYKANKQNPTNQ